MQPLQVGASLHPFETGPDTQLVSRPGVTRSRPQTIEATGRTIRFLVDCRAYSWDAGFGDKERCCFEKGDDCVFAAAHAGLAATSRAIRWQAPHRHRIRQDSSRLPLQ